MGLCPLTVSSLNLLFSFQRAGRTWPFFSFLPFSFWGICFFFGSLVLVFQVPFGLLVSIYQSCHSNEKKEEEEDKIRDVWDLR